MVVCIKMQTCHICIYKEPRAITSEITEQTTEQAEWGNQVSRAVSEG